MSKLYGILFLFMIAFLVMASLIVSNAGPLLQTDPGLFTILKTVAIGIAIVAIPLSWAYPQKLIANIEKTLPLQNKMVKYQQALVFRLALVVVAAILVSFFFLLIGDTNLMLVLAIILLIFILSRPTPFKIGVDLKLSEEEKSQLLK